VVLDERCHEPGTIDKRETASYLGKVQAQVLSDLFTRRTERGLYVWIRYDQLHKVDLNDSARISITRKDPVPSLRIYQGRIQITHTHPPV
jgi:hypothetical protein